VPLAQKNSETQVQSSQTLQLIGDYMSVSCSMLHHFSSFRSISKGHLVLHFLHNDYTRWITANEVYAISNKIIYNKSLSVRRT
jgi:hypothetical protein